MGVGASSANAGCSINIVSASQHGRIGTRRKPRNVPLFLPRKSCHYDWVAGHQLQLNLETQPAGRFPNVGRAIEVKNALAQQEQLSNCIFNEMTSYQTNS